jgi:hypothetical protein
MGGRDAPAFAAIPLVNSPISSIMLRNRIPAKVMHLNSK